MRKIDLLLAHLKRYKSITKLVAAAKFHIYGLKNQINSLIMKGYNIVTEMIARTGRQAYAKYRLVSG